MKTKNIILIAFLVLLAGFVSCKKDHDIPTGKVFNLESGEGNGTNFTVSVSASPSAGGTVTGGGTYEMGQSCTVTATANNDYGFDNWTRNGDVVSTSASYTFTVTNDLNLVANFTASTPLVSTLIEWVRKGINLQGNTEVEMAAMGLKWAGSYKGVFATIEPLNDDVVLYLCDGDDFYDIVTVSDKIAYFTNLAETGNPIGKYRNISVDQSTDYNDILAVIFGESLFLIHITHAEIETGSYGTQITIPGEVK